LLAVLVPACSSGVLFQFVYSSSFAFGSWPLVVFGWTYVLICGLIWVLGWFVVVASLFSVWFNWMVRLDGLLFGQ
jgi:hypothetical protein